MIQNHIYQALPMSDASVAKYVPDGGNWKDVPYELLPDRLKRIRDNMAKYHSPAFYARARWEEPAGTVSATMNPTHCQALPPLNEDERGTPNMKPLLDALPRLSPNGLRTVSLFAGGGLLDLGVIHAGFDVVQAFEFDVAPTIAYAHNIGDHVVGPRNSREKKAGVGDVTKIALDDVADCDVIIGGPPCFPAGQRIITKDGFKNIEDIAKGDMVLTHKGRYRRVVTPMQHPFTGDIYTILPKYYRLPIRATAEHPFWTERGWVEAKDLRTDDYLGFPLNKNSTIPPQIEFKKYVNQSTCYNVRTTLPFEKGEFWSVIGYWLAEGWLRTTRKRRGKECPSYEIQFAANDEKLEYLLPMLDSLGLKHWVSKSRTCYRVAIVSQEYSLFLRQFTNGNRAHNKLIPEFVQDLPAELARAFVSGYSKGDGGVSKGYTIYTSVSRDLIESLQRLLLKTEGRMYSLGQSHKAGKNTIEGREVNVRDCYQLKGGQTQGHCVKFTEGYMFVKVDKIAQEQVNNFPVFNFEVEEDNSYCLPIIAVHNCQDYSVAGTGAGEKGERGKLVWRYLEIIEAKRPKAFLFENVKGIVGKRHRPTFDALLAKFEDIGYRVSWRVLSAWDYGVAQKRERVFIVGIREDLGVTYEFPASEYETSGYRPVLRDAIGDLPEPFPNHIEKPLTDAVYRHARNHNIGYNTSLDAPAATIRTKGEDVLDVANHGIGDYWTPPNDYSYAQANRIQSMDEPSSTILAHHNTSQPIHPTASPRRFTVRECLRIQSVPDSYVFPPQLSLSAMYKATGNGVPPRMAYHLAKALAEQLLAINDRKEANPPESRKQVA